MFPFEVFPDTTEINEYGHLSIGRCDLVDLAEQFGTPLYVYDETTLRNRCRAFLNEFKSRQPNTKVVYASKAFINPVLAKIIAEEGLGLDVVSGGELAVAQFVDFPNDNVYFHGNNKGPEELKQSLEWNIGRIVVDSFYELELLNKLASSLGKRQDIMLRLSPGIDAHTHEKTTTGILDTKFGFSIETGDATKAIRQALKTDCLDLVGIHFHLGSPIYELEPYEAALEFVLPFLSTFREEGLNLREFSPGGGFAIGYTRDRIPPAISEYAEVITKTLSKECANLGMKVPLLTIEPGRAISGPAGVAVYRVGAVKEIPGIRKYVSVDGGMGDNIRPSLYEARYEAVMANRINEAPTEKVTIAGKYCESGDILVKDCLLPPIGLDGTDIIAIPASGAYCPSMASNYNLNPKPPILLVNDGDVKVIRRRETYLDQLSLDLT